jgi:hypothetical protein
MIENKKEDIIESLKLVRAISLKAALDGDSRTIAGMEVIKNCLYELGCIIETKEIINRHLANEYLENCFKLN